MYWSFDQGIELAKLLLQIVALGGAYFAWQHFYTNREKVRFDLFDRRFGIYDTVIKTIEECLWTDLALASEFYSRFRSACNEAQFLLPSKVYSKVRDVRELVDEFMHLQWRLARYEKSSKNDEKIPAITERLCEIEDLLQKKQIEIQTAFSSVLKFEKF